MEGFGGIDFEGLEVEELLAEAEAGVGGWLRRIGGGGEVGSECGGSLERSEAFEEGFGMGF